MRAVVYTRVSTKEQAENLSLQAQRTVCETFCHQQGWEVDRVFEERGESAKTTGRGQFQAMLSYCAENRGRVRFVVVYRVDRFARDTTDHLIVRRELASLGVEIRSASEMWEDNASGRLVETLFAAIAQFDNDVRSDRTTQGMRAAVEQHGKWVWQAPLGYVNAPDSPGNLQLDPVRGPLIRKGFELVASGAVARGALRELTRLGLETRRGKAVSPQSWQRILANRIYRGVISVPKWGVEAQGAFPALIDEVTFSRAQATLAGRTVPGRRHTREHPDFPLRGFMLCGHCDKPLTAAWSRGRSSRYAYYSCRDHCEGSVRRSRLEGLWVEHLESLRPTEKYLECFEDAFRGMWEEAHRDASRKRTVLQAKIEAIDRKKDHLLRVYVYQEGIDKETYTSELKRLNEEADMTHVALYKDCPGDTDVEPVLETMRVFSSNCARLWKQAPYELKVELQSCLFPAGALYANERISNRVTLPFFNDLRADQVPISQMASPTGFEPVSRD